MEVYREVENDLLASLLAAIRLAMRLDPHLIAVVLWLLAGMYNKQVFPPLFIHWRSWPQMDSMEGHG